MCDNTGWLSRRYVLGRSVGGLIESVKFLTNEKLALR
jgi:hypothetical protein